MERVNPRCSWTTRYSLLSFLNLKSFKYYVYTLVRNLFFYFSLQGDQYRKGVRGIPGNPGYFKMHFVNLRTGGHEKITLPQGISSSRRRYLFSMTKAANVTVDLDEGSILLHPEKSYGELNRDVVQNVALAFTVSLLYLVIQCNKRFITKILI